MRKTFLKLLNFPFPAGFRGGFLMLAIAAALAGCNRKAVKHETPPLANSTKTWVIGDLVWSDYIEAPECNKEIPVEETTGEESYGKPDCGSYIVNDKTYYYYNWYYVQKNRSTLCPDGWRIPSKSDADEFSVHYTEFNQWSGWFEPGSWYNPKDWWSKLPNAKFRDTVTRLWLDTGKKADTPEAYWMEYGHEKKSWEFFPFFSEFQAYNPVRCVRSNN
jgi:hypothetical protein